MPHSKEEAGEKKQNKGQFKKGQSGNPGGRKAKTPEQKACEAEFRQICTEAALEAAHTMREKLEDEKTPLNLKIRLWEMMCDQAFGKPKQQIDGSLDQTVQVILGEAEAYAR